MKLNKTWHSNKFTYVSALLMGLSMLLSGGVTGLGDDDKCRVLVMRGGGTKGTYETGALRGIIEGLDPKEYAYDVVSGVSVGAVNAVMLAIYPKGKEADAVSELE